VREVPRSRCSLGTPILAGLAISSSAGRPKLHPSRATSKNSPTPSARSPASRGAPLSRRQGFPRAGHGSCWNGMMGSFGGLSLVLDEPTFTSQSQRLRQRGQTHRPKAIRVCQCSNTLGLGHWHTAQPQPFASIEKPLRCLRGFVGAQHAVPGTNAWREAAHGRAAPVGASSCGVRCLGTAVLWARLASPTAFRQAGTRDSGGKPPHSTDLAVCDSVRGSVISGFWSPVDSTGVLTPDRT